MKPRPPLTAAQAEAIIALSPGPAPPSRNTMNAIRNHKTMMVRFPLALLMKARAAAPGTDLTVICRKALESWIEAQQKK